MHKRRLFDPRCCSERRKSTILACLLLWSVLSYLMISRFVIGSTEVLGESMRPTLEDTDRVLIDRLTYHFRQPERGEIVAIRMPDDAELAVKRIVAKPGEQIQTLDGELWVNGKPLEEPYLDASVRTDPGGLSSNVYGINAGCYFVLGDNRAGSLDSRFFGAVPRGSIVGRIIRPWPAFLTASPDGDVEARQPRTAGADRKNL